MSLFHLMDIAESLLQLDPVRTYPQRGAELVAKAIRAGAWRAKASSRERPKTTISRTSAVTFLMPIAS